MSDNYYPPTENSCVHCGHCHPYEESCVEALLSPYDCAAVECDGFTRIATTLLHENGYEHTVMVGTLSMYDETIPLHFWIELPDGCIVDYWEDFSGNGFKVTNPHAAATCGCGHSFST